MIFLDQDIVLASAFNANFPPVKHFCIKFDQLDSTEIRRVKQALAYELGCTQWLLN